MNWKNRLFRLTLPETAATPSRAAAPASFTVQRLARGVARLQDIELVRQDRRDPRYGRCAEDRIVWRELLELELQDIDEQIKRILAATSPKPGD